MNLCRHMADWRYDVMEHLTFSFIGGDLRQLQVIEMLSDEGYRIKTFGFDKKDNKEKGSLKECLKTADYIFLPLPYTTDKRTINAPYSSSEITIDELIDSLDEGRIVFGGKLDADIKRRCRERGVDVYDYIDREEFAIMNAVPTAEGAILAAMSNTPYTIKGSNCLVVGYGRIGKVLAADLKALGARVTATSRHRGVLAEIEAFDYTPLKTGDIKNCIGEFDIIFNTVPHMVLGARCLMATKKDVLIIDLASKPGGVDFDEAKRLKRKVMWELSLPGKVAPYTAGKIVKDTILNMIEELEV